jgi:hypothetical protein
MNVREMIEALAQVPNQQAEVKVRHGWMLDGARHYTREIVVDGDGEPVIGTSWQVDEPAADGAEPDPLYRITGQN